jgi:hypothetical protein
VILGTLIIYKNFAKNEDFSAKVYVFLIIPSDSEMKFGDIISYASKSLGING